MPFTYQTDGAHAVRQGGNDIAGASTGIGVGSNQSGANIPGNFTDTASDFVAAHIGGGALATSAANTGSVVQEPVAVTAGSGYTNGTYIVESDVAGAVPAKSAALQFTVAGGAITAAQVLRAGSGFTAAPTFTLANAVNTVTGAGVGGGTAGALVVTVGIGSRTNMLGAAFGTNKGTRRLTAGGTVLNGSAISGGYLNRSGRTMVAGEATWAVAP